MKVSVFVPSHITGFFSIFNNEDPLVKGSLGAGVLLNKGVITEISFSKLANQKLATDSISDLINDNLTIKINGKEDKRNQTIILKTIELMVKDLDLNFNKKKITIDQKIEVPIGCGFGTSASSAIGTAICINEIFNLELSLNECGKYAHLGELALGSGLGDVIAEMSKGIVVRTKTGAPGVGKVKSIISDEKNNDFFVITKSLGVISTSSIIQNPKHEKIITDVGINIGEEFLKKGKGIVVGNNFKKKFSLAIDTKFNEEETIKQFMKSSLDFSKKTHLINNDILDIVHLLHGKVLGASMAMLGNTVFAILTKEQKLAMEIDGLIDELNFDVYKIETEGIRISKFKN